MKQNLKKTNKQILTEEKGIRILVQKTILIRENYNSYIIATVYHKINDGFILKYY